MNSACTVEDTVTIVNTAHNNSMDQDSCYVKSQYMTYCSKLTKVIKQRLDNHLMCLSNLSSLRMTIPRQVTCAESGMFTPSALMEPHLILASCFRIPRKINTESCQYLTLVSSRTSKFSFHSHAT